MIHIQNVTKTFKTLKAVDNISLDIHAGEYVALLGPNGAGKTTLVEMIEGLQFPDSGTIRIKDLDWKRHDHRLRSLMGLSLQETKFIDKLTTLETLDLFGSFYRLPKSRSREMLKLVNLEAKEKTYTVNLSGGQRQRLALGVALLNEPEVLLLDEPTTGLDPNARREIWDILQHLKQTRGTTLILTTHYMEEAEYLCDRIIIMDKGKLLADGTMESLLATFSRGQIITFELNRRPDNTLFDRVPGMQALEWLDQQGKGKLLVDDITQALPKFLELSREQGLEFRELGSRKKTLDDLFVAMTGRRLDE